jgi:hypothetical protein
MCQLKVAGKWRIPGVSAGCLKSSVLVLSAPEEIRTPNLLIRSQMLYPLSYGRLCSIVSAGKLCGGERI